MKRSFPAFLALGHIPLVPGTIVVRKRRSLTLNPTEAEDQADGAYNLWRATETGCIPPQVGGKYLHFGLCSLAQHRRW